MGRYWEVNLRERASINLWLIDRATGSWCDLGFDLHGSPCRSLSDHDYWGRVADNVSSSRDKGWA
ncbi:hypothetical protein, partial [Salmonella sp. M265]|uniref:hypothetical protein n=1 Tax=Salmonella sp. M265 TaxID=3240301 RepID=UPI00352A79E0